MHLFLLSFFVGSLLSVLALTLPRYVLGYSSFKDAQLLGGDKWKRDAYVPFYPFFKKKTAMDWQSVFICLLTPILSFVVLAVYGETPEGALYTILTWVLILLAVIDANEKILPDIIVKPMIAIVLVSSALGVGLPPKGALIGAAVGYLSLFSLSHAYSLIAKKKDVMGHGDFKLLALSGGLLGVSSFANLIICSCSMGITWYYIAKLKRNETFPFGPFIAVSLWFILIAKPFFN